MVEMLRRLRKQPPVSFLGLDFGRVPRSDHEKKNMERGSLCDRPFGPGQVLRDFANIR
jgi:hypothetical protein